MRYYKAFLKGLTIQIDLNQEKYKVTYLLISGPYFPIEI